MQVLLFERMKWFVIFSQPRLLQSYHSQSDDRRVC